MMSVKENKKRGKKSREYLANDYRSIQITADSFQNLTLKILIRERFRAYIIYHRILHYNFNKKKWMV